MNKIEEELIKWFGDKLGRDGIKMLTEYVEKEKKEVLREFVRGSTAYNKGKRALLKEVEQFIKERDISEKQ